MTAKEYANKYRERLTNTSFDEVFAESAKDLFCELIKEMRELIEIRKIKTKESIKSLVKEFNIKANKINDLLGHILKRDWFITIFDGEFGTLYKD